MCFWLPWLGGDMLGDEFTLHDLSVSSLLVYPYFHSHGIHLYLNLFFLYIYGNTVSNRLGWWRYFLAFTLFAVFAGAFHMLLDGDDAVGCSGAVAGLAILSLFLESSAQVNLFDKTIEFPLWWLTVLILFKDLTFLCFPISDSATFGHIGGELCGMFAGLYYLYTKSKCEGFEIENSCTDLYK